jgi:hypothetical protein
MGQEGYRTLSTSPDAHAFSNLMRHLRDADGNARTVLVVQVENEVGVIPESRDHSRVANASFDAAVPTSLTSFLENHRATLNPKLRAVWEAEGAKTAGTWQQVFGKTSLTDDLFMAWQYATFIERVAAAGKAEYPIPMYANAALIRPNYEPGQYNSGGPLPHSMDLWRAGAPLSTFSHPTFTSMNLFNGRTRTRTPIIHFSYQRHKVAQQEPPTRFTPSGGYRQLVSLCSASMIRTTPRSISWASPIRQSTQTTSR